MRQPKRQNKNKTSKQIVPKKVWQSLTDKQQQQFVQTIEAICQRLASRWVTQQEGHDAAD